MESAIDFLSRSEVKKFIESSIKKDVNKLVLNPPSEFKKYIKIIAGQILARQKATGKLEMWAENYDLILPPPISIEQSSSDATSAYKTQLISGELLVDLTGGMGIDCLALSKAFKKCIYIERQADLCKIFSHNTKVLGKAIEVINAEASAYLNQMISNPEKTTVYIDPARRDKHTNRVFRIEDCAPNVADLIPVLRRVSSKVLLKYSPILDIKSIMESFVGITEIHVVSVKNDCKELLVMIDFNHQHEPSIHCVNLQSTNPEYKFFRGNETDKTVAFGDVSGFVYEPNSSVMKAGAFNSIAHDFNLKKVAPNTHLYTHGEMIESFPGRIFKFLDYVDKRTVAKYATKNKINVISRNHPYSATELKKKWKIKDGGDLYLIGYRDSNDKPKTIVATRNQ